MPTEREISPADIDTLRRAITASHRSIRAFAEDVLVRDPRTVERWLAGSRPIPEIVVQKCRTLLEDEHV